MGGTDIELVKYTEPSPMIEEYFGTKNKTNLWGEKFPR